MRKLKIFLPLCALVLLPFFYLQAAADKSVRILAYHTFMDGKNIYSFSLEELRRQCEELKADGYRFISYEDFKSGSYRGEFNVLVTIDDGHRTVYEAYQQVFAPLGIKPLLAIYPAIIGKKKFAMTWQQIDELVKDGCSIASHGYYHNFCTESAYKKDPKSFETEIFKSKTVLEEKLGVSIDTFAYPFGEYSAMTIEALKKGGYLYAMTIKNGHARLEAGNSANYELPRYMLTRRRITGISALFKDKKKPPPPTAIASSELRLKDVQDVSRGKDKAHGLFEQSYERDRSLALFDNLPAVKTDAAFVSEDTFVASGAGIMPAASSETKADLDLRDAGFVSSSTMEKAETKASGLKANIYSLIKTFNIVRFDLMKSVNERMGHLSGNIKNFF